MGVYAGSSNTLTVPDSIRNPSIVRLDRANICAINLNEISCWGPGSLRQNIPQNLKQPTKLSIVKTLTGMPVENACVIDNGKPFCWGDNSFGQLDYPQDLGNVSSIYVGLIFTCAFTGQGISCWGLKEYYKHFLNPNIEIINPTQFEMSDNFACILDEGEVKCWGKNNFGQLEVPRLINPRKVAVGENHACALDDEGVKCWGDNRFGQSQVPMGIDL
jgi:alpha-tubulin suppressor-like RCC1 family protein